MINSISKKVCKASLFLGMLTIAACSAIHSENSVRSGGISDEMLQKVSYSDVRAVFQRSCVGCHSAPENSGDVNLESFTSARQHLTQIKKEAVDSRRMPKSPYPPLKDNERLTLAAWIQAGGPEYPQNGESKPEPLPLGPNFKSIKENILEPKCLACHRVGGKAEKIPLSTIQDIVDSPRRLIIRGYPDDSKLVWEIEDKKMPPPESPINPVTKTELDTIKEWIANGASE